MVTLLQTGIADSSAVAATAATSTESMSLFDLAVKGGWIMIVLALLSLVAVYIFVERWLAIRNASKIDIHFMNNIKNNIHDGKIRSAINLCHRNNSPVARMIEKGVERIGRPLNDIQTSVENVGSLEVARLEKGMPILASISGGAPMIGFLGTVIGMVQAFYEMSKAGGNNIQISMLANGIYTAMITTIGGLIVGIFAYFAYNYLVTRINHVVYSMESKTIEFMDLLNEPIN
ncbi:MAG: MotA/TolQ/ExbB proton channel family protein [Prevotellaceae bacterium]|jgi:biopolymer transport protein ExbB|nr:MotA/TolQ/ExbB proton channel family protein [Prevotellaceae bacterium]